MEKYAIAYVPWYITCMHKNTRTHRHIHEILHNCLLVLMVNMLTNYFDFKIKNIIFIL